MYSHMKPLQTVLSHSLMTLRAMQSQQTALLLNDHLVRPPAGRAAIIHTALRLFLKEQFRNIQLFLLFLQESFLLHVMQKW